LVVVVVVPPRVGSSARHVWFAAANFGSRRTVLSTERDGPEPDGPELDGPELDGVEPDVVVGTVTPWSLRHGTH
jgi:hypothetical protein